MSEAERTEKRRELERLIEAGFSCREVAARLGVSAATAIRWTKRAGLVSKKSHVISQETRAAIREATGQGVSAEDVAERFRVSVKTVRRLSSRSRDERRRLRQRVLDLIAGGLSRREAAHQTGVSAATAIRWAWEANRGTARPIERRERGPSRKAQTAERKTARAELRAQLFAAVESGLSRRQAAALVGLPVATAIRWVGRAQAKASEEA